jgi:hypothetical protein
MAASVFKDSDIQSFNNNRGLEIGSWVHFENLKLALWGLDFGFASGFMSGGSGALLKFGGLSWICSQKVSSSSRRQNWFKYRFRLGSTLLGKELMRCHRLLVNQLFDKQLIKREILFIKEVITKEESITPKANLSAWYIDTNLPLVGARELAALD